MVLNKKIVIIINGTGGSGKDTLCKIASKYYSVRNESSIDPIKEIARKYAGWNGKKNPEARRLLSDLKQAFVRYNNMPNRYLVKKYDEFMDSDADILFLHIRERDQIEDFKKRIGYNCVTLLVRSKHIKVRWGNPADDKIENYNYDYHFTNNSSLQQAEQKFMTFLREILLEQGCCDTAFPQPERQEVEQ